MPEPANPQDSWNVDPNDRAVWDAGATSLNSAGGAFEVFRYPGDLADLQHPHWVMFNIVVRKSDLSGDEVKADLSGANYDATKQNRIPTDSKTQALLAIGSGVILGAAAGASLFNSTAGSLLRSTLPGAAGRGAASGVTAIGGLTGAGAGVAVGASLAENRDQILLKKAIALYLPNKPTATYSASWADEDIGIVGGLAQSIGGLTSSGVSLDGLRALAQGTGGAMQSAMLQQTSDSKGIGNIAGAVQASIGRVPNPFKAQLFKTMNFRGFTFDYVFLPKSDQEYKQVKEIVKTFKRHMHPNFGAGAVDKFILNYPAEFTITYFYKDKANEELFRIGNCALTGLVVDYGGTDFTVFNDATNPGRPTEITMKMSFVELEILTQERIDAGF